MNNPYVALPSLKELAPHDFECFARYMTGWTLPKHQVAFCQRLDEISRSTGQRQIFSAPPQHGKSEFVSVLYPAYKIGKDPAHRFHMLSYGADHSEGFGSAVQQMVLSDKYREIFPGLDVSKSSKSKGEWRIVGRDGSHHPSFLAKGIGGGITGKGADTAILDDVIENSQKAFSVTERESLWTWFVTTAATRWHDKTNVIVMFTRWHDDDLVGRILKAMEKMDPLIADKWDLMNFPAIALENDPLGRAPGDPLWPEMHGLRKLLVQKTTSPMLFEALYQGSPTKEGGNYIGRADFPTYTELPENVIAVFDSWDTALTENTANDPTAGITGVLGDDGDIYLWHGHNAHMSPHTTQQAMLSIADMHHGDFGFGKYKGVVIEKKSGGEIHAEYMRRNRMYSVRTVNPVTDKVARLLVHVDFVKTGRVRIPCPNRYPAKQVWVNSFLKEIEKFPAGHDDWVDAFSQLLLVLRKYKSGAGGGGCKAELIQI
jgi:predicted phage terminase large subunit-like protein